MRKKVKLPPKKFVAPENKYKFLMKDHMSQLPAQHVSPHNKGNKKSFMKYHHYERFGHIIPFCYRLYDYPQFHSQPRPKRKRGEKNLTKQVCKPIETTKCLLTHVSFRVYSRVVWHFYSGCSQHIPS